eukprot:TRINITY_DN19018_c0_g1_i1.p1 TRINITY_DN19018_c0_g1~~TRINITY_DN19018_c0_g1_i1.p1  ORF type:complete len:887 (-),score=193.90 TRINITY_DN19018_c0_g1_i1:302-2962(-)
MAGEDANGGAADGVGSQTTADGRGRAGQHRVKFLSDGGVTSHALSDDAELSGPLGMLGMRPTLSHDSSLNETLNVAIMRSHVQRMMNRVAEENMAHHELSSVGAITAVFSWRSSDGSDLRAAGRRQRLLRRGTPDAENIILTNGLGAERISRSVEPELAAARFVAKKRGRLRGAFTLLAVSRGFQIYSLILVALSAVVMSLHIDAVAKARDSSKFLLPPAEWKVIAIMESVLIVLLLVENLVKHIGATVYIWYNLWLMVDTAVVVAWAVQAWYDLYDPVFAVTTMGKELFLLPVLVVFRGLRFWRAIQVFKAVRFLKPLYTALLGLRSSLLNFVAAFGCGALIIGSLAWASVSVTRVSRGRHPVTDNLPQWTIKWPILHRVVEFLQPALGGMEWDKAVENLPSHYGEGSINYVIGLVSVVLIGAWYLPICTGVFVQEVWTAERMAAKISDGERLTLSEESIVTLKQVLTEASMQGTSPRAAPPRSGNISRQTSSGSRGSNVGAISLRQLERGLAARPEIVQGLGISLDSAKNVFKRLDIQGLGYVGIDVFLIELVKLTDKETSMDMLVIEYQQNRVLQELRNLRESYFKDDASRFSAAKAIANHYSRLRAQCEKLQPVIERSLGIHGDHLAQRRVDSFAAAAAAMAATAFAQAAKEDSPRKRHTHLQLARACLRVETLGLESRLEEAFNEGDGCGLTLAAFESCSPKTLTKHLEMAICASARAEKQAQFFLQARRFLAAKKISNCWKAWAEKNLTKRRAARQGIIRRSLQRRHSHSGDLLKSGEPTDTMRLFGCILQKEARPVIADLLRPLLSGEDCSQALGGGVSAFFVGAAKPMQGPLEDHSSKRVQPAAGAATSPVSQMEAVPKFLRAWAHLRPGYEAIRSLR